MSKGARGERMACPLSSHSHSSLTCMLDIPCWLLGVEFECITDVFRGKGQNLGDPYGFGKINEVTLERRWRLRA